jgi:hypothetical protein
MRRLAVELVMCKASRLPALAVILLLAAACGPSTPTAAGTPVATPSPTPHQTYLVLLRGTPFPTHVAIVDMSGHEVAGADFAGGGPRICDAFYVRPPIARIVDGAVYFVDHSGVIRRLDATGATTVVMRLPIKSSQQQPYFAVSPDSSKVMASIVKVPGVNPNATGLSDCLGADTSQGVENFIGDAGSTPRSLGPGDYNATTGQATVVAGWDATGPLGTTHTYISAQNPGPWDRFAGQNLVRLDPATGAAIGAPLGGADCRPVDLLVGGTLLCLLANERLAVRKPDGSTIWSATPPTHNCSYTPAVAPDAAHIGVEGAILSRDGTVAPAPRLATGCRVILPFGWIDTGTMVGGDPGPPTAWFLVKASSPGAATPFPVAGRFVGVVPSV